MSGLLLYHQNNNPLLTIEDSVKSIAKYSRFNIDIFNIKNLHTKNLLPKNISIQNYKFVLIHCTLTYNQALFDNLLSEIIFNDKTPILLYKQDDHHQTHIFKKIICGRVSVVFTCLPECQWPVVYSEPIASGIQFINTLTGYIGPELRSFESLDFHKRTIDIGYRGSIQPLSAGSLAFEKRYIAEKIKEFTVHSNIKTDISCRWEDRIYGKNWLQWLSNCKCTLGTESGGSIFDIDGSLDATISELVNVLGPDDDSLDYALKFLSHLKQFESRVYYNQVAPRHFEAAATRTLQILFEGEYSGIFKPWEHYLPLKKDFSNISQILDLIKQPDVVEKITEKCFNEIVLNPDFSVEKHVEKLDQVIDLHLHKSISRVKTQETFANIIPAKKHWILLCSHPHSYDPRIEWMVKNAPDNLSIQACGIKTYKLNRKAIECDSIINSQCVDFPCLNEQQLSLQSYCPNVRDDVFFIYSYLSGLSTNTVCEKIGITLPGFNDSTENLVASQAQIRNIIKYANIYLNCLSDAKGISGIIAVDFDTLLAGIILKNIHNVPLVYDAHEYWPEQFNNFSDLTKNYFKSLEKTLLKFVDGAWSISPGLVRELSLEYDKEFHVLPNATPFKVASKIKPSNRSGFNRFLFMGNFSEGRGIESLCRLWSAVPNSCHLFLVGPESAYKQEIINIVKALGLFEKTIFFPPPCAEHELIDMATNYDIGLIPYESINLNHAYCSPNKMGQYMAAGIPILANKTQYVQTVLEESQAGWLCDFNKADDFYSIISLIINNPDILIETGHRARQFHETNFNWQKLSDKFYDSLDQLSSITPGIEIYPQYLKNATPNATPNATREIYRYLTSLPHRLIARILNNTPNNLKIFLHKHYNILKYFHK